VEVTAGGVTQLREVGCDGHVWAQSHRRLHFGLATNARARISVRWPDGKLQVLRGVRGDRIVRIVEPAAAGD
jgi:hypothetical protein